MCWHNKLKTSYGECTERRTKSHLVLFVTVVAIIIIIIIIIIIKRNSDNVWRL